MNLSNSAERMAAKTDPKYGEGWLPLWMHLYDTAGVISKLVIDIQQARRVFRTLGVTVHPEKVVGGS
jgi:hypothetical protein